MQHGYVIGSRLPTGELPRRMTQPCLHCLWPKRGRHLERTWWSPLATIAETSRRLKVADRAFQHNVMLEAVQNHTLDVLIIDEVWSSFPAQCQASQVGGRACRSSQLTAGQTQYFLAEANDRHNVVVALLRRKQIFKRVCVIGLSEQQPVGFPFFQRGRRIMASTTFGHPWQPASNSDLLFQASPW